ncbi:hypothetical protein [Sphingobacterium sp. FBM7-1]|uniref:hypothetical protein n=1 Tax=Sphingobacterium sp. FBM7-1 TaxID=2886688 RepID=UPI001D12E8B0|nr:hypothetical protein [Sphingobacterium sp. FBM7-1]MCC2600359.1 hypothetical protein [Sphingobacterium sp. FBM7-1]
MKYIRLTLLCLGLLFAKAGQSQIHYQPYSYEHYQRNMAQLYGDSITHTAVKPFVGSHIDPRHEIGARDSSRSWGYRKLFQEHLVEVVKDDHTFYLDFMPDFILGSERGTNSKSLWTNTRGAQAGLSINKKFSLYVSFYENQARYASFIDSTAQRIGNLPGQGFSKNLHSGKYDWMNATANLTYQVSDALNLSVAYDKLHIGEGYRSVLVSDNPYNFTHARVSGKVGRWQYNSIWAYMNDLRHPRVVDAQDPFSPRLGNGVKYGAFQYVDYLAGDKLSLGLFHSLIWAQNNQQVGGKANGGLGLNVKYRPLPQYIFYAQGYADEFSSNRMAFQLGGKTYDLFGLTNLNLTAEYNQAARDTYGHPNSRIDYTSNAEALAHPAGSNFKELLGIATYRWNRWELYGQSLYARYGAERSNLFYQELRFSYVMNPKYNLRWELGLIDRRHKNSVTDAYQQATIVTFGLRSSFRTFHREY